jgi:hypothetical protein
MKTYKLSELVYQFGDGKVIDYVQKRKEEVTCSSGCLHYIVNHFKQVLSHRKWLYYAFVLIADSLEESEKASLHTLVLKHDLSKFSAVEALGYGVKFGRKGELTKETEVKVWEKALQNHYKKNPHHPEFNRNEDMDHIYLLESILDMLACRMERVLTPSEKSASAEDIFDVPDTFLNRYTDHDKKRVRHYLNKWCLDVTSVPHRRGLAETLIRC